jgi:hypothetical protein
MSEDDVFSALHSLTLEEYVALDLEGESVDAVGQSLW